METFCEWLKIQNEDFRKLASGALAASSFFASDSYAQKPNVVPKTVLNKIDTSDVTVDFVNSPDKSVVKVNLSAPDNEEYKRIINAKLKASYDKLIVQLKKYVNPKFTNDIKVYISNVHQNGDLQKMNGIVTVSYSFRLMWLKFDKNTRQWVSINKIDDYLKK